VKTTRPKPYRLTRAPATSQRFVVVTPTAMKKTLMNVRRCLHGRPTLVDRLQTSVQLELLCNQISPLRNRRRAS
jgi:hypothetical protein